VFHQARKLNSTQIDKIKDLNQINSAPRDMIKLLRLSTDQPIISRDIYNQKAKLLRDRYGYQGEMEYFLQNLQIKGYKYRLSLSSDDKIEFLALANPKSIDLANKYYRVFVLDCTYKTNKYGMPLLEVIGITPTNQTFLFATCFMRNESEEGYKWALQTLFSDFIHLSNNSVLITDRALALIGAIEELFPNISHLLCIWHIEKAVFTKAREFICQKTANQPQDDPKNTEFTEFMKIWRDLYSSNISEEYKLRLYNLKTKFNYPNLILYLERIWLIYKQKFVRCYTPNITHFGNSASSRSEGIHARLKSHLHGSNNDFITVFSAIDAVINGQLDEIRKETAEIQTKIPKFTMIPLFSHLRSHLSPHALQKINNQRQLALEKGPIGICTHYFTNSMGLPCKHMIRELLKVNQPIGLDKIDPFWVTRPPTAEYLSILPPRVYLQPKKEEKKRKRSEEITEISEIKRPKAPSKCSGCGEIGHTIRSCPLRRI
jgi:hypothetical protein